MNPLSLLRRYGTACSVSQTTTTRTDDGRVTATTVSHTGVAYRQKAMKDALGLNPSVSAMLIVRMDNGYTVKTKDKITHDGRTDQVLHVHTVTLPDGVAYQSVGL